jgi:hypothetical protein
MKKTLCYPIGSILTFTDGEYSDFHLAAYLVTIKYCDIPKLAQECANGKIAHKDLFANPENFPAWLIVNGYAMPVDHSEVHLGEYGIWNKEFGVVLGEKL